MTARALGFAAVMAAVLAAVGASQTDPRGDELIRERAAEGKPGVGVACPRRSIPNPEGPGCLDLPPEGHTVADARLRRLAIPGGAALELRPRTGEQLIPRLPDRSAQWGDYQLPVDPFSDVREPDEHEVGSAPGPTRSVVRVACDDESPVSLMELQGQVGPAVVVAVGPLDGVTVVTRHRTETPSGPRDYLMFHGNLARPGPSVVNGAQLGPMAVIGFVGRDPASDEPFLALETRQLRTDVPEQLEHLSDWLKMSLPCDPRNVLALVP